MDIFSHTMSGVAVGTVAASFSRGSFVQRLKIVFLGGLGGALPDIDAISLWSGFDSSIGEFLNLQHSGREIYKGKFWYSHHAFMHSLMAALLMTTVVAFTRMLLSRVFRMSEWRGAFAFAMKRRVSILAFLFGYVVHLFEDLPTPSSAWGGVNLLWPSTDYVGGTGHIWWWNNYDLFLIILSVSTINILLMVVRKLKKFQVQKWCLGAFAMGVVLYLVQINSRGFDFGYIESVDYQQFEKRSKDIQREILGDRVYHWMEQLDNQLPIYF